MLLIRRAHLLVAWAFVAGVVLQVFLAGLGVFESSAKFTTHAGVGFMLGLVPLLILALAGAGRLGRRQVLYAAALFGMFILQSILVAMRGDLPMVAALHPVNGFAILFVSIAMGREAWAARDVRVEASSSPPLPAQGAAGP
jgi:hypothetical protein